LPNRLALFADGRGCQAEASAVDLIGYDVLVKRLPDCRVQPLQQLRESLSLATHETGEEPLVVDGNAAPSIGGIRPMLM